jgi:hypothetical protein
MKNSAPSVFDYIERFYNPKRRSASWPRQVATLPGGPNVSQKFVVGLIQFHIYRAIPFAASDLWEIRNKQGNESGVILIGISLAGADSSSNPKIGLWFFIGA